MYLNVNKNYSGIDCVTAQSERNDCTVRAFSAALDVTYKLAHNFCKDVFGRVEKKGVELSVITDKLSEGKVTIGDVDCDVIKLGKEDIKNMYKLKGEIIWRKKTVKSFVESHKVGTYLVLVAGHILTVKDGELFDWDKFAFQPTRKVIGAYRVEVKEKPTNQLTLF